VIQVTAAITLSRSKDSTEAAGRDTKWSAKWSELRATPLTEGYQLTEASLAAEAFFFLLRASMSLGAKARRNYGVPNRRS
jgi:hypothetical protein